MRFGLFGTAQANTSDLGAGLGQGFKAYVDFNIEAEALGYCSSFLVEHHFTGWNQVSATLNLLTWVAARTRTLRVGSAVMVLPWHNPVLLAEQAATLDLLSKGRLDFGVGKGYRYTEFRGFCIPMEDAEARFEEALEVITRAWTANGRFSHRGRYWQFEDIAVEPPTFQKPHPPFWMAAGSPASIKRVAERGYHLLLDQFAAPEVIGERIALFKAEVEARGRVFDPAQVAVARDVYVARDRADKMAALERNAKLRQRTVDVARVPGQQGGSHVLSYTHTAESTEGVALYGMPDEIMGKVEALRSAGVCYVLANIGGGSRESLRRFAREIMPAFAAREAAVAMGK
ncbi:MAG: LLM class flavin-dependent oxidoreductase [Gammaproteobacteria bacterium]|nr:LLM class flavin-dependent oxidoreductase [Gammaproteobacteria bacterium]MDH3414250.1 LLM class flavin-dependent oxidoreductase [Gammaproteobacteria bacterium]